MAYVSEQGKLNPSSVRVQEVTVEYWEKSRNIAVIANQSVYTALLRRIFPYERAHCDHL